jgi:class 3 adenylate cyclase
MQRALSRIDVAIRAAVHTGEIEFEGGDVRGVGVHIAARILAEDAPGEVLVSRTVHDLVAGSDRSFADRGSRRLKGIEGDWQLFAVAGG